MLSPPYQSHTAMPYRHLWLTCSLLLSALFSTPGTARQLRVLAYSTPLAGFQYHAGPQHWPQLRVGDTLELQREPHNRHDRRAVRVLWRGNMLGYLPRIDNPEFAAALDQDQPIHARIGALRDDANPWRRLRIDLYLVGTTD